MRSGLETATAEYQDQLKGSRGESALSERGISTETQEAFRLGYVECAVPGDERFTGYISIPYLTVNGVVSMRFRQCATEDGPKYLSVHNDLSRPFNVSNLFHDGPVFITEGEMDAIIGDQCGLLTVGFPGAQSWRPVFARMFRFRQVLVLADGDSSGRQFANTVAKDIYGSRVIDMGSKEDVNSVYVHYGERYLREWVGLDE